jgi:hypothetical protein
VSVHARPTGGGMPKSDGSALITDCTTGGPASQKAFLCMTKATQLMVFKENSGIVPRIVTKLIND